MRSLPHLEGLRVDSSLVIYVDQLVKMVKARKAAAGRNFVVNGIQMKPIRKLTVDFSRFNAAFLSKLQEMVLELLDDRYVPKKVTFECYSARFECECRFRILSALSDLCIFDH